MSKSSKKEIEVRKFTEGKTALELLPFDALEEIAEVLTVCSKDHNSKSGKYPARSWEEGIHYSKLFGAMMRHSWRWFMANLHCGDNEIDPETGIHHLAHAGCNLLFLLAYALRGVHVDFDDRPTKGDE